VTELLELSARVLAVVALLISVTAFLVIGPARLREMRDRLRPRLRAAGPSIAVLAVVLLLNSYIRDISDDLSWLIGINITGAIFAVEGTFVAQLQTLAVEPLTMYFSFVYVYGYAFLLIFPLLAYLALSDQQPLRLLTVAYILNYTIGLVCYLVFIAYGPRNFMPDLIDPLLYTNWPQSQVLTSEVNRNTNVFPSLHTSLAATVAILARRTRDAYPYWYPLAVVGAASVAVSTMYLGIHWGIDVLAGLALGAGSVVAARRIYEYYGEGRAERWRDYLPDVGWPERLSR